MECRGQKRVGSGGLKESGALGAIVRKLLPDHGFSLNPKKNARPCFHGRALNLVAKGGIEPPTQGFSVLCSTN